MKTRLLGAAVLIALAVLFVPMFFSSTPPVGGDQSVSLAIPPAPDRDLQTRTMDLRPGAPSGSASTPAIPRPAAAPPDQLATVDIASQRPRDVGTAAPDTASAPDATAAEHAASDAPVDTPASAPETDSDTSKGVAPASGGAKPVAAPATATATATAARGDYTLNLSAYANHASAQRLIGKVKALGYPVAGSTLHKGGKALTLVTAGPFSSRTAAEAARLKITQTIPGAPAHLESTATDQHGDVAAKPAATRGHAAVTKAGGYAVQVAAMAEQADANALRDRLRGAGFDGFVDSVSVSGRRLWRVRAGPMAQRDDAMRVRDQIKTRLALNGNVVSVP